jgi:hypothetical protein
MPTADNQKKGEIFEKYVVALYEALNFHVSRNVNIGGQQVDIVAEKIVPGIGKIKTLIECKYLTSGSVANQIVYTWGHFISTIPKGSNIISGVIISNQAFGKEANLAAQSINITLLTEQQLESEIFQLKESYIHNVAAYEQTDIYQEYLPLDGISKTNNNFGDEISNIGDMILNRSYDEWSRIKFVTILADFGSGKTTLMQWLNYQFSKKYLEGSSIKPLYCELKYFFQYQDISLYMVNTYRKLFQKDIPVELFWKGIANGEFILLLDGFDEMSPQVDRQIRIQNFQMLSKLLLSKSNTILSCRSSYFISDDEFIRSVEQLNFQNQAPELNVAKQKTKELISKQKRTNKLYQALINKYTDESPLTIESEKIDAKTIVVEIAELSGDQIDKYLQKFDSQFRMQCNASWDEVRDFCYKIYDIKDLLKKPILLGMVKDTMLSMGNDFRENNEVYDPSSLYETYTNANLHRDYTKGVSRQFLSTEQRKQFAEQIASLMFENNKLEISLLELYSLIRNNAAILGKASINEQIELEQIASDIVLCTFIKRTENTQFKFIHKSFMEFFVARKLKILLLKNDLTVIRSIAIIQEVLYFIGCYATIEEQLMAWLVQESISEGNSKQKQILKRNAAVALLLSRNTHDSLQINNVLINEIKLSNQLHKTIAYRGVKFENTTISEIIFKECHILQLEISNSFIDHITFEYSDISLQLTNTSAIKVIIINCKSARLETDQMQFKELNIVESSVTGSGSMSVENADYIDSKFIFRNLNHHFYFRPKFSVVEYFVDEGNTVTFREPDIKNSLINIIVRDITISSGHISQTDFILNGKISVTNSKWTGCSCLLSGEISCIENEFDSVIFKQKKPHSTYLFSKNTFTNCSFIGITITAEKTKDFLKNKLSGNKGFIFVTDQTQSTAFLKFNRAGFAKIGNLYFIDVASAKPYLTDDIITELENTINDELAFHAVMAKHNLFG